MLSVGDLICAFLHISFLPFSEPKQPKTPENDQIMLKISLEYVFKRFRCKRLKTNKKLSKIAKLSKTVPELSENDRNGP